MSEEMNHDPTLQEELDVVTYMEEMKQMEYIPSKRMMNPGARYICPYGCSKLIALRTIDYHKNNGCGRRSDHVTHNTELKKKYYCCGVCYLEFVTRAEFHAHLRVEHDVHPEIHQTQFKDRPTFDRFLRWLEMEGGAHFRHKSGSKRRARGKGIFLACNRSGYVSTSQDKEASDRTGPFRLGYSCTAYIHATEHEDGHVTAEVCPDHYGHDARMRLPNIVKYIIAHKQLEGEQPVEIIGYLRNHFMSFSQENIYAQRICFVDTEELKAIFVSSTKKWEVNGIPQKCEIWEEELLDRAGIVREGVPRLRDYSEKTSSEMAVDESWPRPRVFVAKVRTDDGLLVPVDVAREVSILGMLPQEEEFSNEQEEADDSRYMAMEEFVDDSFVNDSQVDRSEESLQYDESSSKRDMFIDHEQQLLDDEDVEVEVETEVETSLQHQQHQQHQQQEMPMTTRGMEQQEEVLDESQGGESVENMKMGGIDMDQQPGPSNKMQNADNFYDGMHNMGVQSVIEELESMKLTLMKRGNSHNTSNMRSFLIRLQNLHAAMKEKTGSAENQPVTLFPSRQRMNYRPGKVAPGLERPESHYMNLRGDVTLLPIEDDMSDDEILTENNRDLMSYNSNIWS